MPEVRRNQWGQYLVVPPGGKSPIGYVRATTVAKTLDSEGGLAPWKATAAVVGAMRRPGLHARWQALIATHPDPWYGSEDSKAQCKKLVEECQEAGGSTDRADLGTALHAIIEQRNLGRPGTPILQQHLQADVDAYAATIDAAGITFNPNLLEAMVVLDQHRVAGTADLLEVDVPGHGKMVGDLKTGTDLQYSWQSIAVQLATYAHADNVYVQGEAADGSQDQRLPMPELSQQRGLVIHLPAGEARCDLYLIDLVAGWDAFERSMWTRQWRQRKTLARLYTPGPGVAPPAFDEPTQIAGEEVAGGPTPPAPPASSPATSMPDFDSPATAPARDTEPARAGTSTAGEAERTAAPASPAPPPFDAPAANPAPSTGAPAPASIAVEPARPTPPFDSPQPDLAGERTLQELHELLGDSPDDGEPGDDKAYLALQKRYTELPADAKAWFAQLTDQSIRHRCSFHSHGARTVRRFEIIRGLTELAAAGGADDETLRCVLAGGPTPIIEPTVAHDLRLEPGHLLGSLDAARAAEFARRAGRLAAGDVPATVDEATGRVVLDFTALAALAA